MLLFALFCLAAAVLLLTLARRQFGRWRVWAGARRCTAVVERLQYRFVRSSPDRIRDSRSAVEAEVRFCPGGTPVQRTLHYEGILASPGCRGQKIRVLYRPDTGETVAARVQRPWWAVQLAVGAVLAAVGLATILWMIVSLFLRNRRQLFSRVTAVVPAARITALAS